MGNESRGDDGLAPLLLRKLDAWLATQENRGRIELLEDFQLQIEHAADLVGRELVLFIDAGMDTPAPWSFCRIEPQDCRTLFSHALAPEAVLATYSQVYRQNPPPAFVLCLRGEQFELGVAPSAQAVQHMELAYTFMRELLQKAEVPAWENRRTTTPVD
ncbi:MAG: Ni/Fe hydrogenase [Gallionellaceae bacterium]